MKNYPKSLVEALSAIQQAAINKENVLTTVVPDGKTLVTWSAPKGTFIIDGFNQAMCLKYYEKKIFSVHFIAKGGSDDVSFLQDLLNGVFKQETLKQAGIEPGKLAEILADYKQKFPAFTTKIEDVKYFRIEEENEHCRLIVSVDPPTGTIRYSITQPSDAGIITPVQQYFEQEYVFYKFIKHEKIDCLNFWEQLSFHEYPQNDKNLQKFEVVFGLNYNAIPVKQLTRSFNRQRKFLGLFLDVATQYIIMDAFGKKGIDMKTEKDGLPGTSLSYYQIQRFYTHTEFKMIVLSQPMETESGAPLASMVVIYQPLYVGPVPEAGWTQHDLVYEAAK